MMTVNHEVVAFCDVAVFLDIRRSQIAVCLFKVVLQIEVRVVLRLHYRVIDGRAGNGNPTYHILILQIQLLIFCQHILALTDGRIFWHFSSAGAFSTTSAISSKASVCSSTCA